MQALAPPAAHLPTLIRDLPSADRPRERLRGAGAAALSNAELLAILLRTGSHRMSALAQANALLARFEGLRGMRDAPFGELCREHGMGEAKAAQVKAALELGVRLAATSAADRPVVRSPEDIANLVLADMALFAEEHVRVLQLDVRNRVIGQTEAYKGSVHTAHVRITELFTDAVRLRASSIALVHNHPSGSAAPSSADIALTKAVDEAARIMDIAFHDHIIIGDGSYVSLRALGLGFAARP